MDKETMIIAILIALGITIFAFYFIIKLSVEAGTKELKRQYDRMIRLKILELKRKGCSIDELKAVYGYNEDMDKINASNSSYEEKKQKINKLEETFL